jgi:hypothetical protein
MLDKYIRSNAGTVDYYINKFIRTKRFESRLMRLIISGYIGKSENLKTNSLDTVSMNNLFHQKGSVEVKMEKGNIQAFENTMNLIKSHKSKILLVMMPMYKIKYQTFNRTGYEALCNYLREYCRTIGGAEFIDLNYASLTNRPDLFSDFLHFNVRGQTELTDIISTILMTKDIDQRSH